MLNLAPVKDKYLVLSNNKLSHFKLSEFKTDKPCIDQEFIDTLELYRESLGKGLQITSGVDMLTDTTRNASSAHSVIIDKNGQVLKACQAADVYSFELSFETMFREAVKKFSGVGLYISEVVPNFKFIHVDTMVNKIKRPKGYAYWIRNRKASPGDKNTYSVFDTADDTWEAFVKILKEKETV